MGDRIGLEQAKELVDRMSAGEIAGLVAAAAFVLLVGVVAIPMLKLGKVLDETTRLVAGVTDETLPLLKEVTATVTTTNTQLVRVDAITSNAQAISGNVASVSTLFVATVGGPMVKVAAFTYGVRRAMSQRRRTEVTRRVRAQMRTERAGRAGRRVAHHRRRGV